MLGSVGADGSFLTNPDQSVFVLLGLKRVARTISSIPWRRIVLVIQAMRHKDDWLQLTFLSAFV